MRFASLVAISALFIGGQPLVSDFLPESMADTGAAFAKGKVDRGDRGNSGGGNRGASQRENGNSLFSNGSGRPLISNRSGRPLFSNRSDRSLFANQSGGSLFANQPGGSLFANQPGGSLFARANRGRSTHEEKPTNVHARLKALNSLNRNINGLMNSSDPKMDLFREFVIAGADYEIALAAFTDALDGFDTDGSYQALLDDLGLPQPTTVEEFEAIADQLLALSTALEPVESDFDDNAAYQDALDRWQTSTSGAVVALALYEDSELSTAVADASDAGDASSEDAMIEAMVAGLNATGAGPVTEDDMSPDMIEWVAGQMGVGDADGFIDAYLAQTAEEDAESVELLVIDGETVGDTNG